MLDESVKENERRVVSITGYRVGEKFFLDTKFNTKPGRTGKPSGRGYWFRGLKEYKEKLHDVTERQADKFSSGEIEEIL